MTLKVVLLDFGNTLVSTRLDWARILPANLSGLRNVLAMQLPNLDWERLGRDFLFLRAFGKERAKRELIEIAAVESLQKALALQGYRSVRDDILQAGVDGFFAAEEMAYPIIFGIPETLTQLRAMDLRLGVVTNATCGQLIRRALSNRRLLPFFEFIAVSAELGPCKPDPSIFWASMHALQAEAGECVVVGDQLDTDIEGARRAGMGAVQACFFGEPPAPPPDAPRPDAQVRRPQELIELISNWKTGAVKSS